MKVAALDFGTNSFILLVAEVVEGQIKKILHDDVRMVRLGQGVHQNRKFHEEALERARLCLEDFSSTISSIGVDRVLACATSAARDVSNANVLLDMSANLGIPVKVISGEEEAELTFAGVFESAPHGPVLIVDVGGGSTEFIYGNQNGIIGRKSLNIGSVRLTEMFVSSHPVPNRELDKMRDYISNELEGLDGILKNISHPLVIGVAGTPITLNMIDRSAPIHVDAEINDSELSLSTINKWVKDLASMTVEQRRALVGMVPKRADVIVAGAMILGCSLEKLNVNSMNISTKGLRYGIARMLGSHRAF